MVMLLTNHTLTGVVLGLSIDHPAVLAPTAIASHLALDAVPHFGHPVLKGAFRKLPFLILGSVDFAVSIGITITACVLWPQRLGHILLGVFGAALPDLVYIPIIVFGWRRLDRWFAFYRPMIGLLAAIQWYERPPGLVVEAAWASAMLWLLSSWF